MHSSYACVYADDLAIIDDDVGRAWEAPVTTEKGCKQLPRTPTGRGQL